MCDTITLKRIFGSLTDHHYERTKESWKHLENLIARYQNASKILAYNMVNLIREYRRSPDDNVFDIVIKSNSAAISCEMSQLLDEVKPSKFVKESTYHMVLHYESVDENTINDIWSVLGYGEDKVVSVKMRGSTFFVLLN
jgi:hypothetical protein